MTPEPPPPPIITPRQLNLLRIVSAMAWADGNLAAEEVDLMLDRFSRLFAGSVAQRQHLQEELREYLVQNLPLEELVPQLATEAEKELVLQLGYETIAASARSPEEANINEEESAAYTKLVSLLGLPAERVQAIESEAQAALDAPDDTSLIDSLAQKLAEFIKL